MSWVLAAASGVLAWTFLEYAFHRFVAHEFERSSTFQREHLRHHRERNYFASPAQKARLAATVMAAVLLCTVPVLGLAHAAVFSTSLVSSYLVYEWIHRDLHVRAPWGAYGRWARRHHMHHHHVDPNSNHGVTSPLWDWVFGTWRRGEVVRVARGKRPDWLEPGATAAWAADYEIVGARSSGERVA